MKSSVILCTKDREKNLIECIHSINQQTILPDELIIVDDGNLDKSKIEKLVSKDIKFKYFKKTKPGLTASRNIGIRNSSGDIIFFFDDDTILDNNYLNYIFQAYKKDRSNSIKGVGGLIIYKRYKESSQNLFTLLKKIFFISPKNPGIVLPSGFWKPLTKKYLDKCPKKNFNLIKVQALPGCCQSYRKKNFKEFLFDENLSGYALVEDVDISYRIFKKYSGGLYVCLNAKLIHKVSKISRITTRDVNYKFITQNFYFFQKNVDKTFKNYLIYLWSIFGLIFIDLISLIKPKKVKIERLNGKLKGLSALFKVVFLKQNINKYL